MDNEVKQLPRNQILLGDALEVLNLLPNDSVDCSVSSIPYFQMRDYGVDGQIGLEETPAEYIAKIVAVYREIWRVLKPTGTCWLNCGDSYANDTKWGGQSGNKNYTSAAGGYQGQREKRSTGLKPKDLMLIPQRLAIALQDDGWWIRNEIIWEKVNPMPESVTDRCTRSHEQVYLLTKNADYWYDQMAIAEPLTRPDEGNRKTPARFGGALKFEEASKQSRLHSGREYLGTPTGTRNKRDVWRVASEPNSFAHFATFPKALITPMILAGCPDKCCAVCGAPWERVTEPTPEYAKVLQAARGQGDWYSRRSSNNKSNPLDQRATPEYVTTGFRPTCAHADAPTVPGLVLDPFMGSGTTALVARSLGRDYLGVELNEAYINIAKERLRLPFERHYLPQDNDLSGLPLFTIQGDR